MKNIKKIGLITIITLIIIAVMCLIWYKMQQKSVTKESKEITIEIEPGMKTDEILRLLKKEGLIKNIFASEVYIVLNKVGGLQAGTYCLNSNMNLKEILYQISSGNVVDSQITITFLEGKNIRWIAKEIASKTNNTEEDTYNLLSDKTYIKTLIEKYWFLTDEITNEDIYYPLEGYLYPETYKFESKDVSVKKIFEVLLNQTDKVLTKYKSQIEQTKMSIHEIITISSIIELEGNDTISRKGIANVIYNRLNSNMSLGSDVTTYYAIKVDVGERELYLNEINSYNAYNTRGPNMSGKLPIGPISSVSEDSINAAINPDVSDYLYFVADINGKIYFSSTYEEHRQVIKELQKQGLWYEYK